MTRPRPHPHFDDRGTHDWHTRWNDALRAAMEQRKILLVDFGREACGQCRTFVQSVLTHPQIAPLVQERCVLLASDCDDPEDEVTALAMQLEDAEMLPFVLFADATGKFLGGSSGAVNPLSFKRRLEELGAPRS